MRATRILHFIVAIIGIALSAYLLREHYVPSGSSFCNVNETITCDVVNQSVFAEIFGIPIALLGMFNYLFLLGYAIFAPRFTDARLLTTIFLIYAVFGFLFSAYLTSIETFVLHAYCILCVISAVMMTVVFVFSVRDWREKY